MNIAFVVLMLVATFIVQSTLVPYIEIFHAKPDLLLIVIASFAIMLGAGKGMAVGFFAGLVQDLLMSSLFGVNTLSKMLVGLLVGALERKVFKDNFILPFALLAVTTLVQFIAAWACFMISGMQMPFVPLLMAYALPSALYNAILAVPIYTVLYQKLRF